MEQQLAWNIKNNKLYLSGELNKQSLLSLWAARHSFADNLVNAVDVAQLTLVDSAGLALLVYFNFNLLKQKKLQLEGVSPSLMILIELYNLRQLLNE